MTWQGSITKQYKKKQHLFRFLFLILGFTCQSPAHALHPANQMRTELPKCSGVGFQSNFGFSFTADKSLSSWKVFENEIFICSGYQFCYCDWATLENNLNGRYRNSQTDYFWVSSKPGYYHLMCRYDSHFTTIIISKDCYCS